MGDFFFQRVKIPYARGSRYLTGQAVPEALVSRKVVYREVCTEGGVSVEMSGGHFEVIDPTVGQTAIPIAIGTVLILRQAQYRLNRNGI